MVNFADEARSRTATLLRMANTKDERIRARIIAYAESTPEPVMGPDGLLTRGCPQCAGTMWNQRDSQGPLLVCGSCGRVEAVADEAVREYSGV